jgi:hypothetical protein
MPPLPSRGPSISVEGPISTSAITSTSATTHLMQKSLITNFVYFRYCVKEVEKK